MSRIGKMPVAVPAGVEVTLGENNTLTVKGAKGTLERALPAEMVITCEEGRITVQRPNDLKRNRALHGLTRALINNMVIGVSAGFQKKLEIIGTGYRAAKDGDKLTLTLGYSHPVVMPDPEGVTTTVEAQSQISRITVSGIDKQRVGQHAANIRAKRPPEPYNGKGIKYDNEKIIRKAGKAGKK